MTEIYRSLSEEEIEEKRDAFAEAVGIPAHLAKALLEDDRLGDFYLREEPMERPKLKEVPILDLVREKKRKPLQKIEMDCVEPC